MYLMYKFDVIRDCIPDLMHQWNVVIKDFAYPTVDLFRAHNKHVWLDQKLKNLRSDLPTWVTRGRRIPWHMTYGVLSAWTAEECLVWVRIIWQVLFLEVKLSLQEEEDSAQKKSALQEIDFVQQLWELVNALYSAINHVDGMQGNPETVVELAVALVSYNSPHTTSHSTQPIA